MSLGEEMINRWVIFVPPLRGLRVIPPPSRTCLPRYKRLYSIDKRRLAKDPNLPSCLPDVLGIVFPKAGWLKIADYAIVLAHSAALDFLNGIKSDIRSWSIARYINQEP